ncbi:MAG: T9SS type A sorting domain-containing protein, partial [Bacteroidota bacterium]|nr:T9SS type A sorting domain-containing protein [Bacteroidota bacterium]
VGIGSVYTNRNIFDYLDFGIYAQNSNVSSVNNSFQFITGPTTLTKPAPNYGAAIYGISDALNLSKRLQVGNLTNNSQKNTFYDCARGIDVNGYYDTRLSYNRYQSTIVYAPILASLSPVGNYGVFIKSGRFINNTCDRNEMVNMNTSVMIISDALLIAPLSYSKFLGDANINGNIFSATVPPYAAATTQSARNGVVAQNVIPTCTGCVLSTTILGRLHIDNNVIDKLFNGISIQNWPRVPTANINQITLRFQPNFFSFVFAQNAIRIINCGSPQVYRNTINQGTTTKLTLRGIYVSNSSYSVVRCNIINGVGQDLVFEGPCLASTVFNNDLGPAQDGLVLMNNGQIGPQGNVSLNLTSDNRWIGPFSHARTYTLNTYTPNTHSPLVVRNTSIMNPGLFPLTNLTSPGVPAFDSYNAAGAISTAVGGTAFNCQQAPAMATGQPFTSVGLDILQKNVQNQVTMFGPVYEAQWMAKQKVGELLKDDPSLIGNSQILQQFEASMSQEEFGKATRVNGSITDNNFANAIAINSTITRVSMIEQNQQIFNSVYLDMVSGRTISAQQRTDIENIAAQCPVTGGPAVYQARALLTAVYDDYVEWVDNCNFPNSPPAPRFGNPSPGENASSAAVNLYPNPNNGEMSLDYTLQEGQTAVFYILDVTGRVLMTKELANNEQHTQVSAADLASGIYIWQVIIDGKVARIDKLIIAK